VGYTNAGKSSLLNYLTGAGVVVEDQLFSTLDPVTRRIELSTRRQAVITDTVGFIDHLPHQLVEAFKSTLEEVKEAEVLMHVVDASSQNVRRKLNAVDEVLEELGACDIPTIYVFNKGDLLREEDRERLRKTLPQGVFTSTFDGEGMDALVERMSAMLASSRIVHASIPHGEGELLALVHRRGRLLEMESDEAGHHIVADIPLEYLHRFEPFTDDREQGE
jgi:GTP-binding protein HflX